MPKFTREEIVAIQDALQTEIDSCLDAPDIYKDPKQTEAVLRSAMGKIDELFLED